MSLRRPWLCLPAKLAHDLAPLGLELGEVFLPPRDLQWRSFSWQRRGRTLYFRNPVGIAGGVDKDGRQISGWHHFGAGFIEIGTVTPQAQTANAGTIIGRDIGLQTLWNRMGFPNRGSGYVRSHLIEWRSKETTEAHGLSAERAPRFPVLVNIGKNRGTPLEHAAQDYVSLIEDFAALADAAVINISSPNTAGLRDLLERRNFERFLAPVMGALEKHRLPGLLKLSPDLGDEALESVMATAIDRGIDGFVATNTTLTRDSGSPFPNDGGISGAPLRTLARSTLEKIVSVLGDRRGGHLVVSVGGVMTPDEAALRLQMGADLVECYSALVFEGPNFLRAIAQHVGLSQNETV